MLAGADVSVTAPAAGEREVIRAAAQWLALVESGSASAQDLAQLQHWRESHSAHESAWQKAQGLRQRFSGLPPALAMATLDRPDVARRALLKHALGVAVVVPTAWLLTQHMPLDVWRADLHSATGERTRVRLADGSAVQLNTDSAVNVDLKARQLTLLRGELALSVPGRAALTVGSPYGRVSVSHSDVCLRLTASGCQVSVLRGTVQVQPLQGAAVQLHGGQQVMLRASGATAVTSFDADVPGWRDGVLMAHNQPLGDFLRELDRYRPGVLRWEPSLEHLRVTGSFQLDDTDRILALLAVTLPVEVHTRTRYWVTLVPRHRHA